MLVAKNDVAGTKTEVELTLANGKVLYGEMFLSADCQVIDLLNDDQQFLPFEDMNGAVSVINKTSIAMITQHCNFDSDDGKLIAFG